MNDITCFDIRYYDTAEDIRYYDIRDDIRYYDIIDQDIEEDIRYYGINDIFRYYDIRYDIAFYHRWLFALGKFLQYLTCLTSVLIKNLL